MTPPEPPEPHWPLEPGTCLGVIGGGQLGRYFVLAARRLGFDTAVLDPDPAAPAMQLGDTTIVAAYDDAQALEALASRCHAVTLEFENVPAGALETLARRVPVFPRPEHVAIAQDRRLEKRLAAEQGLATARWQAIEGEGDAAAPDPACLPGILKTARLGYDGKGQCTVHSAEEVLAAWQSFGRVDCVLEERLTLVAELSAIVVRARDGRAVVYPPAENVHRHGILHTSTVPARSPPELLERAATQAVRLADAMDYVGVLAIEYFVVDDGTGAQLRFNEMAPRPHNSGHWTLDACQTSQFEQQARVLAGWPAGSVRLLSPVSMLNLLGGDGLPERVRAALTREGAALHLYGKRASRPGRKMGHVNCLDANRDRALDIATSLHEASRD